MRNQLTAFLITLFFCIPAALADSYKCTDSAGRVIYQDKRCATNSKEVLINRTFSESESGTSTDIDSYIVPDGNPNEIGLWQEELQFRPRVSHPEQNPYLGFSSKDLDQLGDIKYFLGAPLTTVKCSTTSVLKESLRFDPLRKWDCKSESQNTKVCSGIIQQYEDYRTGSFDEIAVKGDFTKQVTILRRMHRSQDGKTFVIDEARIRIRYLGRCKDGMSPGDQFWVENGKLVRPR